MGCLGVGEAARGEQLRANQGQEWMGICITSKEAGSLSKYKEGLSHIKRGRLRQDQEARGWVG